LQEQTIKQGEGTACPGERREGWVESGMSYPFRLQQVVRGGVGGVKGDESTEGGRFKGENI